MDTTTRRSSRAGVTRSHSVAVADRAFVYIDNTVQTLWPVAFAILLLGGSPDPPTGRVRALEPFVLALIEDTAARSMTVRELLGRLASSDVIVYVEMTASAQIPVARTKLVTTAPGVRFLRIGINAALQFPDLAPTLAHELQHAVEIAEHEDVTDDAAVRRLYERIGRARGGDRYETDAARNVEWIVRGELRRRIGG
jgi:hypothetical protein